MRLSFAPGLLLATLAAGAGAPAVAATTDRGVALVELFTSEGCSSCPPADALLARLAADAERSGRRVYCLSFHVDYWDQLGWKDRFSSAAFSRRQGRYAAALGLGSLYTPQMVVNGEQELVGSDAAAAESAIAVALQHAEASPPALRVEARGRDLTVHARIAQAPPGAVLAVAWVDARAVSSPHRGENDGRTLHHVNVVRDLRSVAVTRAFDGTVRLTRPDVQDGAVIAWVQEGDAGRVLGAASVRVAR